MFMILVIMLVSIIIIHTFMFVVLIIISIVSGGSGPTAYPRPHHIAVSQGPTAVGAVLAHCGSGSPPPGPEVFQGYVPSLQWQPDHGRTEE